MVDLGLQPLRSAAGVAAIGVAFAGSGLSRGRTCAVHAAGSIHDRAWWKPVPVRIAAAARGRLHPSAPALRRLGLRLVVRAEPGGRRAIYRRRARAATGAARGTDRRRGRRTRLGIHPERARVVAPRPTAGAHGLSDRACRYVGSARRRRLEPALRLPSTARPRQRCRRRIAGSARACRCRGIRPGTASGTVPCHKCRWRGRRTAWP
jgi:hypothetical protein